MKQTALTANLRIGSMDRKITFRAATETQDAIGHPATTWADAFDDYAAVGYAAVSENYQADVQVSVNRVSFTTRSNSNTRTVTAKHRIAFDGKEYDIEGITEPLGRLRFLVFNCKLRE